MASEPPHVCTTCAANKWHACAWCSVRHGPGPTRRDNWRPPPIKVARRGGIDESQMKKGGVNEPPDGPRPADPPKPQDPAAVAEVSSGPYTAEPLRKSASGLWRVVGPCGAIGAGGFDWVARQMASAMNRADSHAHAEWDRQVARLWKAANNLAKAWQDYRTWRDAPPSMDGSNEKRRKKAEADMVSAWVRCNAVLAVYPPGPYRADHPAYQVCENCLYGSGPHWQCEECGADFNQWKPWAAVAP